MKKLYFKLTLYLGLCGLLMSNMSNAAPLVIKVSGQVTDSSDGTEMIGCSISEKGTTNGVLSDASGNFSINVKDQNSVLVFDFIGYARQEVVVGSQTSINIQLVQEANQLDDIVVLGYGTQKKSDVTGSVGTLKSEDFNKGVVANPGQLLQGKIAGVNVTSVSGEPGAAQDVVIRGVGSLRSGTTPLYVIDGFVLDNSSNGFASNPLNFINPQDIESINVLKDASAAAIYGARAANGVIVITTKKGKEGKSEVNLSISTATSTLANKIDVFSAADFRKNVVSAGGTLYDAGGNTDWQDELTRTARSTATNLSMSGAASEKFSYFASLGLDNQEGILNNSSLKRYSGRLNLNQTALDGKLKIAYNFIGAQTENSRPDGANMVVDMLRLNPTIPARTNGIPTLLDDILSPVARQDLYSDDAVNSRIIANIAPSLELYKGLTYKLNLGVDFSSTERVIQTVPYALLEGLDLGSLNSIYSKNSNSLIENTLNYVFTKDRHNMSFLAGHSFQKFFENQTSFERTGFANNDIEPRYQDQLSTTEQPTVVNTYATKNELQSFFGRVNYGFADKYMVTATFRADGSSKFGANNKYGYFPSFAAGWNITNEDFMSGSAFTNLKLRASWGQTGNQEIPSKITQANFNDSRADNDTYPLDPSANTLDDYPYGTIYTRLANPNIQWEVSTQSNIGLDFGLFSNKLTGTVDYFNKASTNILLEAVPADPIQPTPTFWTNVPNMEIRNSGLELSLDFQNSSQNGFYYNLGGNITFIKNKVVDSPYAVLTTGAAQGAGQTGATINGYINGEAIGSYFMKEFIGIGDDGLNLFKDQNGDGQVIENDRIVVGSALPSTLYAFYTNFGYKNFDLSLNFNGVSGNKIYNHTAMSIFNKGNIASSFNTTDFAIQYPEEAITNSNEVSTRYLEDGSYLRMNNATLAYKLSPQKIGIDKWVNNIRFSVTGQNLFVITKYTGYDPEINSGSSIGGVQTFGIDRFTYPKPRTFLLGLNVTF
ncbi:SusC/RagA family TonB-linked outer membrane protein [Arcticibacterium luteifluviistationis]|uniref:SusC/RagA family TonB-linked outer membrane protein n=1 Tax=Arcticibacterium luteifluviistationis TaxID=1784714 RepID=A0A2Z4GBP3_9BACT|nr:TonB-dependent receptor [Arcticibacterium luteifluviistationis]AWV98712.1 SusC/RagA family TonB-linked outer membrane protein [Arcticibacterium luteifluviistationis]